MTLIEIFDHSPLQNISGVFRFPVDKVYLAGSNARKMSAVEGVYRKVWQRHGKNVEIQLVSIPTYVMMCAAATIFLPLQVLLMKDARMTGYSFTM